MAIDDPQYIFPFSLTSGTSRPQITEQDGDRNLMDQAEVLLRTPLGSREELPDYGIPDLAFLEGPMDTAGVMAVLERWAPGASYTLRPEEIDDLTQRVRIELGMPNA